jgi:dTDP-4-amino-4,6-dideoxygalactose transaminase
MIGEEEKRAVLEVLESGMLAEGPRVKALEDAYARRCSVGHAIATSSGTAALHLALLANGVGPGDEVITTSFTFIASVNSILFVGARPVFVDIEERTFNLDPSLIESAVTPHTKAIMPVHLFGLPTDMDPILDIARRHSLVVIEDACQAIGATYKGRAVGSFGTGAFSLYATKNVMAGEDGMITTDDPKVADACRILRNHGMKRRYYHECLGYNFRMSDVHAAIGLAQMSRFDDVIAKRRANAAYLTANITSVLTPGVGADFGHVWHQYTVRAVRDRDEAVRRLNEAGVGTGVFYPVPAHKQDYVRKLLGDIALPVAERLAGDVISLPVRPNLAPVELEQVVVEVNKL